VGRGREGEEEEQESRTGCKRHGSCTYIFYKGGEISSSCFVIPDDRYYNVYLWIILFHADLMCANEYRRENKETMMVRMMTASLICARRFPLILHITCWTPQHHW